MRCDADSGIDVTVFLRPYLRWDGNGLRDWGDGTDCVMHMEARENEGEEMT